MTLAPRIDPEIRGVPGSRAEMNVTCAAPACISRSQQGHHMWPRSYLRGQPTEWVRLPSGKVVSNVVGLCVRHHNDVTGAIGGHKAMIRLEMGDQFIWLHKGITSLSWVLERRACELGSRPSTPRSAPTMRCSTSAPSGV